MFSLPSPLEELKSEFLLKHKVRVWLKRDDLIHPTISGNKWRKLSHFFTIAQQQNLNTIISFGGAWSNHIFSLAAAGKMYNFKTVGIIRGEKPENLSSTLQFALENGMELHFVSREEYRNKEKLAQLFAKNYPNSIIVPEGGASEFGTIGCEQIYHEIEDVSPDFIALACGTATTMLGIAKVAKNASVIGFSALKNGAFLLDEWSSFIANNQIQNVSINSNFSGKGYAKSYPELEDFIVQFYEEFKIQLEPVYTGKMMFGLMQLIKQNYFPENAKIVAIHTGGLQGLDGFPELKKQLKIV